MSHEDRKAYAETFVRACRSRGLDAVAITDHHDFAFFGYIKQAAQDECDADAREIPDPKKLTIFPGMELTLGVPCQALLILDAHFPPEFLQHIYTVLAIDANHPDAEKHAEVKCLEHLKDLVDLHKRLEENTVLKGRYIILPNVSENGNSSILRSKFKAHYKSMPCVGGYLDGSYSQLGEGKLRIINGADKEYGNKIIGVFPTSDNRREDFRELGQHTAWVKWAEPTAEALRQACLARDTRILTDPPQIPSVVIESMEVTNSKFLGPIDLEFNSQYNCLIGGRGTGKSSLLEYLRWALCDQPPAFSDEDDEIPDFQAKRASLIANTLMPLDATVTVGFSLNGVPHLVRRAAKSGVLSLKIATNEYRDCSEQEIRDLLPVRAYSQKQLSAVGVRSDELIRFIEAPIKKKLADLSATVGDLKSQVRSSYQDKQRKRSLERDIARDRLEAESLQQQIDSLRGTLTGLSDDDRRTLSQHDIVLLEEQILTGWVRELDRIDRLARELGQEVLLAPRPIPEGATLLHNDLFATIGAAVTRLVAESKGHIDAISSLLSSSDAMIEFMELRRQWTARQDAHNARYDAVKGRASSNETQLKLIGEAEGRLRVVRDQMARSDEKLEEVGRPEEVYQQARRNWVNVYKERGDMLEKKCEELTKLSGGRIRASMRRGAGTQAARDKVTGLLSGTNIRGRKVDDLFARIEEADYPANEWDRVLGELEELILWASADGGAASFPTSSLLVLAGFTEKELDRIGHKLTLDDWLDLSLIELSDLPNFEYRQRENSYIGFREASAGQQATALLRVLLNQEGPPLIIDQPEDDLDNQVILEIVSEVWRAKMKRQLIFSSHNANLVVNGDADLVIICDYRTMQG